MKTIRSQLILFATLSALSFGMNAVHAQSTVFTYQGRVLDNGTNFNGTGQFKFALLSSTNFNRQATAAANLSGQFVTSYNIISSGSGYVSAPAVIVSGGGGSGATATATLSGGVVTAINPVSAGSGYASAPTVALSAPPANISYTTYWSNDGTSSAGSQPTAAVGVGVANGLFTVGLGDTTIANMTAISASLFAQPNLQLRIWFSDGVNGYAALSPVQNLTPSPYAITANTASNLLGTLPAAQLVGNVALAQLPSAVVTNGTTGVTLTGTFTGNGAGLTNLPSSGGGFTWQIVTGTNQQAQSNTGYLANNAAQVTITLPSSPILGSVVRVSGVGAGGWRIAQNTGQLILTDSLLRTHYLMAVASSSDGTRLVGAGDGIYISTNSGAIWTPVQKGVLCSSAASSSDGSKLVAGGGMYGGSGPIYTSTNSGATWTTSSAPSTNWVSVASSTNGSKLVAAVGGGYGSPIYISTNSGATWMASSAPSTNTWSSVASSSDGSKLVAAAPRSSDYPSVGSIWISANSGAMWTVTSAPDTNWSSVASSSDGSKLVAAVNGGLIYTSANSGSTWTPTSAPSSSWSSVASSSDGSKLFAAIGPNDPGLIYTSTNSGATWTPTSAPPSGAWTSVASSSDGSKFVVVGLFSIYTPQSSAQTATTSGASGYLTGGQDAAIELQYVGNGQFRPLSFVPSVRITAY